MKTVFLLLALAFTNLTSAMRRGPGESSKGAKDKGKAVLGPPSSPSYSSISSGYSSESLTDAMNKEKTAHAAPISPNRSSSLSGFSRESSPDSMENEHGSQNTEGKPFTLGDRNRLYVVMANTDRIEYGHLDSTPVRYCGPPAWVYDESAADNSPVRVYVQVRRPDGNPVKYVTTLQLYHYEKADVVQQSVLYINHYFDIYKATLSPEFKQTPVLAQMSIVYVKTEDPSCPGRYVRLGGILERIRRNVPAWVAIIYNMR